MKSKPSMELLRKARRAARAEYNRIIDQYPNSPQAATSRGMKQADKILNGFGIEGFASNDSYISPDYGLDYVNLGDTYDLTVCHDGNRFFIGSWGDWLERMERKGARFD